MWIKDPAGGTVQLQHVTYAGGTGPTGAHIRAKVAGKPGAFALQTISHATLHVKDAARAKAFYQSTFGMAVQTHQGAIELLQVGDGPGFIAFAADGGSGPHHVCFTIKDFDDAKVMAALAAAGFANTEGDFMSVKPMTAFVRRRHEDTNGGGPTFPRGTAELYFADPDGTLLQLQDLRYCGGSGRLGEICP
jgi:catechol 2,3-dioxygenase-like lactoylglutathione lyase family enzyme